MTIITSVINGFAHLCGRYTGAIVQENHDYFVEVASFDEDDENEHDLNWNNYNMNLKVDNLNITSNTSTKSMNNTTAAATPRAKPKAGSTTFELPYMTNDGNSNHTPSSSIDKHKIHKQPKVAWTKLPSSSLQIRGENYMKDRRKIPSSESLYELIQVDAVHSDRTFLDVGNKFDLSTVMLLNSCNNRNDTSANNTENNSENNSNGQHSIHGSQEVVFQQNKNKDNCNNIVINNTATQHTSTTKNRNWYKFKRRRTKSTPCHNDNNIKNNNDNKDNNMNSNNMINMNRLESSNQKTFAAPRFLIISFLLPTSAPKLGQKSNEHGYIVTGYYQLRPETEQILNDLTNHHDKEPKHDYLQKNNNCSRINAVKLWENWCQNAPHDPEMQKRLKFIPRGDNLRQLGVPNWICKYNAKPMLIKRPGVTNFVFSHYKEDWMEIDISMHPLPFMFKQAMNHLHEHYFHDLLMTFGFLIEGREEDELPEVLLGNPIHLIYVKHENVMKAKNVFGEII